MDKDSHGNSTNCENVVDLLNKKTERLLRQIINPWIDMTTSLREQNEDLQNDLEWHEEELEGYYGFITQLSPLMQKVTDCYRLYRLSESYSDPLVLELVEQLEELGGLAADCERLLADIYDQGNTEAGMAAG